MAHISSIGAGLFSDLSVHAPATEPDFATLNTDTEFKALFATEIEPSGTKAANTFVRIKNVREFPSLGTPANIVNVPVYGSKTSVQVQGQADAPSMELTINYVAEDWAADGTPTILSAMVGDGLQHVFRFSLLNSEPSGTYASTAATGMGSGGVENSQWFFVGKLEALLINPQLTDANTATLTISVQSAFYGAYTSAAA